MPSITTAIVPPPKFSQKGSIGRGTLRSFWAAARNHGAPIYLPLVVVVFLYGAAAAAPQSGSRPVYRLKDCALDLTLPAGFSVRGRSVGPRFLAAEGPGQSLLLATCRPNAFRTYSEARQLPDAASPRESARVIKKVRWAQVAPAIIFKKTRVREGRRLETIHLYSAVRDFEYRLILIPNQFGEASVALANMANLAVLRPEQAPALDETSFVWRQTIAVVGTLVCVVGGALFWLWRRRRLMKAAAPAGSNPGESDLPRPEPPSGPPTSGPNSTS